MYWDAPRADQSILAAGKYILLQNNFNKAVEVTPLPNQLSSLIEISIGKM